MAKHGMSAGQEHGMSGGDEHGMSGGEEGSAKARHRHLVNSRARNEEGVSKGGGKEAAVTVTPVVTLAAGHTSPYRVPPSDATHAT